MIQAQLPHFSPPAGERASEITRDLPVPGCLSYSIIDCSAFCARALYPGFHTACLVRNLLQRRMLSLLSLACVLQTVKVCSCSWWNAPNVGHNITCWDNRGGLPVHTLHSRIWNKRLCAYEDRSEIFQCIVSEVNLTTAEQQLRLPFAHQ